MTPREKHQCKHVSTLHVPYTLQRQAEEPLARRSSGIGKWLFLLSCTLLLVSVGSCNTINKVLFMTMNHNSMLF